MKKMMIGFKVALLTAILATVLPCATAGGAPAGAFTLREAAERYVALLVMFNNAMGNGFADQDEFDALIRLFDEVGHPEHSFAMGLLFPKLAEGNPDLYARITAPRAAAAAKREVQNAQGNGGDGQEDGGPARGGEGDEGGGNPAPSGFSYGGTKPYPAHLWTNMPPGAVVHEPWTHHGVSQDTFHIPAAGLPRFPVRGNLSEGFYVSAGGTLGFDLGDGRRVSDYTLAVLAGRVGVVAAAGGRVWHAVTSSNSVVITWEHVFLNRDPMFPATFQAELFGNGDWVFRYCLINPDADYTGVLEEFTVGATIGGEAMEWPSGAGTGGGGTPPFPGGLTGNPGGAEIAFSGPGEPVLTAYPTNVCVHSMDPFGITVSGTNGHDGVLIVEYAGQSCSSNPASFNPDPGLTNNTYTVTLITGAGTYATNGTVSYCKRLLPADDGHGNCDCSRHWCGTCEVEYPCPPSAHGCDPSTGGTNAPPVNGTNAVYRGRAPLKVLQAPRPEDFVTFYPAGRYPGTNDCDEACGHDPHHTHDPCCGCPGHNPKPPGGGENGTNAVNSVTNHLRLTSIHRLAAYTGDVTNPVPLAAGSVVHPGTAVHVTGITPSKAPGDATAVFKPDDGDPVINQFTVADVYVFGDYDGNYVSEADIVRSIARPPEPMPLWVGGEERQVNLHPQAELPGQVLVTLGGTPGAIRLRLYDGSYLEHGQALTNPPPQSTYAEALLPGTASVNIAFRHETTNSAPDYSCSFSLPVMAYEANIKVSHSMGNSSFGSPPKYNGTPRNGSADNLFSTWPGEQFKVDVVFSPKLEAGDLPNNAITWTASSGEVIPNNSLSHTFTWSSTGVKTITVNFPLWGFSRTVHVDVPDVGTVSRQDAALAVATMLPPIPTLFPYNPAVTLLESGIEAMNYANQNFGNEPMRDAFRHAYWNALAVSHWGVTAFMVDLVTTGHEFDNRASGQQAFNSSMDLYNNRVGQTIEIMRLDGAPAKRRIRERIIELYASGDFWIWRRGQNFVNSEQNSEGILIKSNRSKIYND